LILPKLAGMHVITRGFMGYIYPVKSAESASKTLFRAKPRFADGA
jgi:hypothetical protein